MPSPLQEAGIGQRCVAPDLVDQLATIRPDIGAVFMSGYSHEVLAPEAFVDRSNAAFIEKPFNAGELLRTVRAVIDRQL